VARKFLFGIAGIIGLILAAGVAWQFFGTELVRAALVPSTPFVAIQPRTTTDYDDPKLWLARPDLKRDLSLWRPKGIAAPAPSDIVATFFVHPTSYLNRSGWNAPDNDQDANELISNLVQSQASAFRTVGPVWAPRYRQATFGSFLEESPNSRAALDAAYKDVATAFDNFLVNVPADKPILLAGHSQGTVHLLRLMRERISGKPLAKRIVAAYLIGWPISITEDLPSLGLPACTKGQASNCILSWQSFAEPADIRSIENVYNRTVGFSGKSREGTPMLCNNMTGAQDQGGYVTLSVRLAPETYQPTLVPASCSPKGFLIMPNAPDIGAAVMPGNNYHVFDYALFWKAIESDVATRVAAFGAL
jgi:hypothetical protein